MAKINHKVIGFVLLNIVIVAFVDVALNAATAYASTSPNYQNINQVMTKIGKTMVGIYPLVVAKRKLKRLEIKKIKIAISRLSELFAAAEPFIEQKSDGYKISYEFVSQYLKVVKSVLNSKNIDYARSHLYALGEVCTSCHTQDTVLRTLFKGTKRTQFDGDYAYAEFNYMTRNYDQAVKYYEKFLDSPGGKTELEIIQPLQRIITVYTQIDDKAADGVTILKKYLPLKDHTPDTQRQLQNWIRGLQQISRSEVLTKKPVTFARLKRYVGKYLGNPDNLSINIQPSADKEVQRVWLRGQLYHYLNREPDTSEIPEILYWLAILDRSIAYNFYFSMTDLYLKQCVLKYPKHPIAQRCYQGYKDYVDFTYARNGEPVPSGIKKEMEEMDNKLPVRY